ncbi:hypothetical protein [Echinicola rosea]|uniref:DUF541 domain-containing protein n=1 Tax=Echinicola rosea TaxID=1807691 RepID=A0ABQ1VAY2_9BACT|nr:hypothetical protein [Echinicola rosea]GGF48828.1 hypothetical protein GCM10011339_41830 [Echinicola rosea]
MYRFILKFLVFSLLSTAVISCNFSHPESSKSIELIGHSKITLEEVQPCINVSFNGSLEQKKALEELMEGEEMQKYKVEKTSESFYKDGMYDNKSSSGEFTYGQNYIVVLKGESDKSLISDLLSKKDIPANINSNGYYLAPATNKSLQDLSFQRSLANAQDRIAAYADSLDLDFEIMGVEEIDDYQLYPVDGIVYNKELSKKVKVKARLMKD